MTATANSGFIKYNDLRYTVRDSILSYAKNIDNYAGGIDAALKYPYTYTQPITVQDGNTPKITWTNSPQIAVTSKGTFDDQYNTFCDEQKITNDDFKNKYITTASAVRFINATFCFIQSKFTKVYSPFTTQTVIYYIGSWGYNTSLIGPWGVNYIPFDINEVDIQDFVRRICLLGINGVKNFCAVSGYTLSRS